MKRITGAEGGTRRMARNVLASAKAVAFRGLLGVSLAAVLPATAQAQNAASPQALRLTRDMLAQAAEQPASEKGEKPATPAVPDGTRPTAAPAPPTKPDPAAEIERNKSYVIPAIDIIGFDFLLNRYNRFFGTGKDDYKVTLSSIRRNLRSGWVTDNDPFEVNQLGHPYQGSMYHSFARSAGLSYWQASAYAFMGSAAWEIAGENTRPSKNDQVASGIAGSFLGEALFRMSSLVLERGDGPSGMREVAAAVISPATGFNRLAYGDRFDNIFSSHDALYYSRLSLGAVGTTQSAPGTSSRVRRNEVQADYSLEYGLPGKAGYDYSRPFDYFTFQGTLSSADGFDSISTRGLLFGSAYGRSNHTRGLWGLYGSYDYIAPQIYRISSTALSLGTTLQTWLTEDIAIQGTGLLGAGYAAASTIRGNPENDYHYGIAPQALLAMRLIFGNKAAVDITGREYFVSRVASSSDTSGRDNISRADVAFTWRVAGRHGITVKYQWNHRNANYIDLGDRTQTRNTVGVFYTFLGHDRFGAVDWH